MSESYFYVGNTDILFDFYVRNSDTPTILTKKSLKIAPFLMPEKVLRVSFARYAFGISTTKCIQLGAKSPKTPDIYIGAPLFDALLGKVLHFLAHLLKNGSTF